MKSHKVFGLRESPFLAYDFQSLGKLEYKLSQEWEGIKNDLTDTENIQTFDNHAVLSRLWVLAGYEFIRQIRMSDKRPEVEKAHELFRRVRIPMVKYEKPDDRSGISYSKDFGMAYLSLSQDTQDVGWAVASNVFISRNELANALYDLY